MYINIHTHHSELREGIISIGNLYKEFDSIRDPHYYSLGLHPWHLLPDNREELFRSLSSKARMPRVLAIGETGLDKACATPFDLQEEVFADHITLAHTLQKPLILHCVRAYTEIMSLLRRKKVQVPVIFHGFNKSLGLAQQLVANGYYLSFGKDLAKEHMRATLSELPAESILLETDNSLIPISEVYALAAAALKIDEDSLSLQIQKNAADIFGPSFLNV